MKFKKHILVILFLFLGIIALFANNPAIRPSNAHVKEDLVINNVTNNKLGGDFILTNQNNQKINSKDLRGKLLLIYFGFTFCPDICPTTLQIMGEVVDMLGEDGNNLVPLFVTLDPGRDTANQLKEYMEHFNPKIIALTGNVQEINDVTAKYKVYSSKAEPDSSDKENYLLNHSSFIYLIDKDGKYLSHFNPGIKAENIVETIFKHIRNGQS
jgi:protein SCO1/2